VLFRERLKRLVIFRRRANPVEELEKVRSRQALRVKDLEIRAQPELRPAMPVPRVVYINEWALLMHECADARRRRLLTYGPTLAFVM